MPHDITVKCDICGEQMKESAMAGASHSAWLCYPCNNVIYESDLWRFDSGVEAQNDSNNS